MEVLSYRNVWILTAVPIGFSGAVLTFAGLWGVPYLRQVHGTQVAQLRADLPDGTCAATVGPMTIVNTSGCERSMTFAAPLTGCGDDVAPIAFAGGDLPAELRWHPVPGVAAVDVPADLGTIADPLQRQAMVSWLDDPEFAAGARHRTRMTKVDVDVGAEALITLVGAALVGDDPDQCQWTTPVREVVGVRRGDKLTELEIPTQ